MKNEEAQESGKGRRIEIEQAAEKPVEEMPGEPTATSGAPSSGHRELAPKEARFENNDMTDDLP